MATSQVLLNPYQPVRIVKLHQEHSRLLPHADLHLRVDKRWLVRRFRLQGLIDTEIVWDARSATEFVSVGGSKAASQMSFLYVPRFDFEIPFDGRVIPAAIEVRIAWLIKVIAFQLVLDDYVVYREGFL